MQKKRFLSDRRNGGFTLIELLIVIAIILILIAIALPNFLAAVTRSKVAREKTDMRTLSIAIESLRADRGLLLVDFWDDDSASIRRARFAGVNLVEQEPPSFTACCSWHNQDLRGGTTGIFTPLTTPVAYLTSVPADPFEFTGDTNCLVAGDLLAPIAYQYIDNEFKDQVLDNRSQLEPLGVFGCWRQGNCPPGQNGVAKPLGRDQYVLIGFGPDGERCPGYDVVYAPTNGTGSPGDVVFVSGASNN